MTREQFEKACTIRKEIDQVSNTVAYFARERDYALDPITRQSGIYLRFGMSEHDNCVHLSEGEVVTIANALREYKNNLEMDFGGL